MREILDHFEKERQLYGDCSERLRECCCFGDEEGVKKILELSNIDINSQNKVNGWTALHWAAKRGYVGICVLLLKHGANPEITNASNQIPEQLTNDATLRNLLSPNVTTEQEKDLTPNIISCVSADGEKWSHVDIKVSEDTRQCNKFISDKYNSTSSTEVAPEGNNVNGIANTSSFDHNRVVPEKSVTPPSNVLSSTPNSNCATNVQSLTDPDHRERCYTSSDIIDHHSGSCTDKSRQNSWPANDNPGSSGNSGSCDVRSSCSRDSGSADISACVVADGTTEVKQEQDAKSNSNPISLVNSSQQLQSPVPVVQDLKYQSSSSCFSFSSDSALVLSDSQWSPTGVNNRSSSGNTGTSNITGKSAGVGSNPAEESKDREWTCDKQSTSPPGPQRSERSDHISSREGTTNCANYVICASPPISSEEEQQNEAIEVNTCATKDTGTRVASTSTSLQDHKDQGSTGSYHHHCSNSVSPSDRLSNCDSLPEGEESATNKQQNQEQPKMPQPSINLVPSYMSRVRPPTTGSLSSYNEEFTYPWKKLQGTQKTVQHSHSMPSTPPNNSGKSNESSSQHQSPLVQNNTNQASIYNTTAGASNYLGVIKNGNTSAIHDLNPSPVASGSGIFSSNESMPIAVAETPHSAASNMDQSLPAIIASGGRILKVRVSDQCDKDFVEIDLPVSKLSIQGFLEISCHELGLEYPVHIERIRKLPNTRLRRDVEVQRLPNYQELELVLSKYPPAPLNTQPPPALNNYPLKTTSSRSSTDLMM